MADGLIGFGTGSRDYLDDKTIKSTRRVDDNEWRHVVVTRNSLSGDMRIFINGVLDS